MRRHVVGSFVSVDKSWISLWYQLIYEGFEILSYAWISVFIDTQATRGMLQECLQKPNA